MLSPDNEQVSVCPSLWPLSPLPAEVLKKVPGADLWIIMEMGVYVETLVMDTRKLC